MKIPINTPIFGKEEIDEIRAVLLEKSLTSSGNVAVTEWAASNVLSLPVHPLVNNENLQQISKILHTSTVY